MPFILSAKAMSVKRRIEIYSREDSTRTERLYQYFDDAIEQ